MQVSPPSTQDVSTVTGHTDLLFFQGLILSHLEAGIFQIAPNFSSLQNQTMFTVYPHSQPFEMKSRPCTVLFNSSQSF